MSKNEATIIDPILISGYCQVLDTGMFTVEVFVSDHKATYVSVRINMFYKILS